MSKSKLKSAPDFYRLRRDHYGYLTGCLQPIRIDRWLDRVQDGNAIQRSHPSGDEVRVETSLRESLIRFLCGPNPIHHHANTADSRTGSGL